jgi:hypothetical protein
MLSNFVIVLHWSHEKTPEADSQDINYGRD